MAGELSRMQSEIELIGQPAIELEETNRRLSEIGAQLFKSRKLAEDLRARVGALRSLDTQLNEQHKLIDQVQRDIVQVESSISAVKGRIKEQQALIDQSEVIKSGYERLEASQGRFTVLEASRQKYEALRQEQNNLARSIDIERTRVESEIEQIRRRIEGEYVPLTEAEPNLLAGLGNIQKELATLAGNEKSLAEMRDRIQSLATGIGEAQSPDRPLSSGGKAVKRKVAPAEKH